MGRAPCCDKANVKKGPWSPEEDAKLKSYIEQHGTGGNWIALPQKIGLKRCGKSCRLRWLNYLRPNIKHGGFTEEEDRIICSLYVSIGSRWSIIAAQLPGRTDNDIKNYWNTRLKKKLFGRQRKENRACRSSSTSKQEMSKRTSGNPMLQDNNNNNSTIINNLTTTFLPEYFSLLTPMLYLNQEPNFLSHHASFSNLLSGMHGRYSDNENPIHERTNNTYPFDQIMSSTKQPYSQTSPTGASFAPVNVTNNMGAQAAQPYIFSQDYLGGADYSALQGESNIATFENISYNVRNPPRFEALENLYDQADQIVNDSWGEISPLLTNPLTLNCGTSEQGLQQESNFNELRYLGVQ